jgi:predicted NBD/HSP70 family sugar kinase
MLYRSHDGSAGEIGHITIDLNGVLCRYGLKGCLDTVAGSSVLRNAAKEACLRIHLLRDLESLGNPTAPRLLRRAGTALGTSVAALVHLNNPQCVLFMDMKGFDNGVFRTSPRGC